MTNETKYIIKLTMNRIAASKYLNNQILTGINKGYSEFKIIIQENSKTYLNICVPIAETIDYYREKGISFEVVHESVYKDCFDRDMARYFKGKNDKEGDEQ